MLASAKPAAAACASGRFAQGIGAAPQSAALLPPLPCCRCAAGPPSASPYSETPAPAQPTSLRLHGRHPPHRIRPLHRNRSSRHHLTVMNSGTAGGMASGHGGKGEQVDTPFKRAIVGLAVLYIAVVVLLPFFNVFIQAFAKGVGAFLHHLMDIDFLHAVKLTLMLAAFTVPINSIFGTIAAINITRNEFPGKVFLLSLLDLPFSISPVVTGLMLTLLFGRQGWFAPLLRDSGFSIVFAFTGMLLATMFVTLPFVVRELIPILETMDLSQEEAARTLGASDAEVFWHVTLPNIRWGLLYGIILTNARAMGEFGAVSVISGNIIGKTQTMTLFVESAYKEYCSEAAFAAAVLLSFLALITLVVKDKVEQAAAAEARK